MGMSFSINCGIWILVLGQQEPVSDWKYWLVHMSIKIGHHQLSSISAVGMEMLDIWLHLDVRGDILFIFKSRHMAKPFPANLGDWKE